jgi:CRISPR/Cas system CSM-associated protein Csm3 (group 7 of RAMP superfamily)
MLADYPVFYLARLVLETRTPLSIATGRGSGVFDSLLVRDANDLPAIPGSSFAGVLRHQYQSTHDETATRALFGYARRSNRESEDRDQPSQVHVSWGCIHDSCDHPVTGLVLDPSVLSNDPLLGDALQPTPVLRQHVRLTGRGAAAEAGQFDRTSLRAGHRFTIELSLWSDKVDDPRWDELIGLLARPEFRLGGATRRGLGALRVVRMHQGRFCLSQRVPCERAHSHAYGDFAAYTRLRQTSLSDTAELIACTVSEREPALYADIYLTPCHGYRFGSGNEALSDADPEAKLLSVRERRVVWEANQDAGHDKGELASASEILIPASSVKGALSHRLAFHYNALNQRFADTENPTDRSTWDKSDKAENPAVRALFGHARDDKAGKENKDTGRAGQILLDDLYLRPGPSEVLVFMHNSIDRFTGGARQYLLYGEELVGQKDLLHLRLTVLAGDPIDPGVRHALGNTLDDLVSGRLALGAGGGRGGHGFFTGDINWSDNGQWIGEKDA